MTSIELLQSWLKTEMYLNSARALLGATVASEHATALSQMDEFLEHNELGLAYECLKSIAEESQWEDIELLNALRAAAQNMELLGEVAKLDQRIAELS